jgi:hypothetical protein
MRYLTSDQDDHSAGFASRAAGETMVSKGATSRSDFASAEEPIVYVVVDDAEMRAALGSLFRSVDLQVKLFRSAPEIASREPRRLAKLPGARHPTSGRERTGVSG